MKVLTVNAGSSSLKLAVVEAGEALASETASQAPRELDGGWLRQTLRRLPAPDAVAHRVVHGGRRFTTALRIDAEVVAELEQLSPLAPLHQPPSLESIRLVEGELGRLPTVACFDTAFFAGLPDEASTYAIPEQWRLEHGVRRYGFHGLSHSWIARLVGGGRRLVSCHLGSGASLAAVLDGRAVDTTMGFTPAEGLVMATRPGNLDPGVAPYLLRRGLWIDDLEQGVELRSGLAGLAGTPDMATVLASAARGEARAVLARDVYLHRLAALVAAMTAALGGLDVLAFTGGVGERSAEVRAATAARCAFLGIELDAASNRAVGRDGGTVSSAASAVRVEVVPAREDLEMAREAERVLGARAS